MKQWTAGLAQQQHQAGAGQNRCQQRLYRPPRLRHGRDLKLRQHRSLGVEEVDVPGDGGGGECGVRRVQREYDRLFTTYVF